jgi:deoxyxylulose-5-phosphate synthase
MADLDNTFSEKAKNLAQEYERQRDELEYNLKLQIARDEQEINRVESRHQVLLNELALEYKNFKSGHEAHKVVQVMHQLQTKVQKLEEIQDSLLHYIKFGELRFLGSYL